jgi:anti-sigma factor RsiW
MRARLRDEHQRREILTDLPVNDRHPGQTGLSAQIDLAIDVEDLDVVVRLEGVE